MTKNIKEYLNIKFPQHTFTSTEIAEIEYAIGFYNKPVRELARYIGYLIEGQASFSRFWKRIEILNTLKNNTSSQRSFMYRYGFKLGRKKYREYILVRKSRQNNGQSLRNYIHHFGVEQGNLKWNDYLLKRKRTYSEGRKEGRYKHFNKVDLYIKKYGKEEGTQIFNKKNKLASLKNTKKYLIETHGVRLGCEISYARHNNNSLATLIRKHGPAEGNRRHNAVRNKHRENRKKETIHKFLSRTSLSESNIWSLSDLFEPRNLALTKIFKICLNHPEKTFTEIVDMLEEYLILKDSNQAISERYQKILHGELEGEAKHRLIIEKIRYKHSINYFIDHYGESLGTLKFQQKSEKILKHFGNAKTSKISLDLFSKLNLLLPKVNGKCYFDEEEFVLYTDSLFRDSHKRSLIKLDFKFNNKVIEFFGDYWHGNPRLYDRDMILANNCSAKDLWSYDKARIEFIKRRDFNVKVIWEFDYRKNPSIIINECIEFLNGE